MCNYQEPLNVIIAQSRTLNKHVTRCLGQQFIESELTAIHWLMRKVVTESIDSPNEKKKAQTAVRWYKRRDLNVRKKEILIIELQK